MTAVAAAAGVLAQPGSLQGNAHQHVVKCDRQVVRRQEVLLSRWVLHVTVDTARSTADPTGSLV